MALQAKRAEEEMQKLREKKELAFKTHQELLQQVEEDADRQAAHQRTRLFRTNKARKVATDCVPLLTKAA